MTDNLPPEVRSRIMASIRGKDTKPEIVIRKALHALGFRYRLHKRGLPGRPDIVLRKYNAVIFVHGCFWHMHNCHIFKMPTSRMSYWKEKLEANRARDEKNTKALMSQGWRVLVVRECAIFGRTSFKLDIIANRMARWLLGSGKFKEIKGR